jgi:hypothetical protein
MPAIVTQRRRPRGQRASRPGRRSYKMKSLECRCRQPWHNDIARDMRGVTAVIVLPFITTRLVAAVAPTAKVSRELLAPDASSISRSSR